MQHPEFVLIIALSPQCVFYSFLPMFTVSNHDVIGHIKRNFNMFEFLLLPRQMIGRHVTVAEIIICVHSVEPAYLCTVYGCEYRF